MSGRYDLGATMLLGTRERQEDAFFIGDARGSDLPIAELDEIIAVVCDGLGGQAAGNVASQAAAESFARHIASAEAAADPQQVMLAAVERANSEIHSRIEADASLSSMASTLVSTWIRGDEFRWISVGDSHLYHARDAVLTRLNTPHRVVSEIDDTVVSNALSSCLSGEPIPLVDTAAEPVKLVAGDWILLTSDGVETLDPSALQEILARAGSAQAGVDAIASAVLAAEHPDQDNTTLIAVRVNQPPVPA